MAGGLFPPKNTKKNCKTPSFLTGKQPPPPPSPNQGNTSCQPGWIWWDLISAKELIFFLVFNQKSDSLMSLQMWFEINRFSPLCCYQTFRVSTLGAAAILWLRLRGGRGVPCEQGFGIVLTADPRDGNLGKGEWPPRAFGSAGFVFTG